MATRVLVVDDENDIVELVRYHAERQGFECLTAREGGRPSDSSGRTIPTS